MNLQKQCCKVEIYTGHMGFYHSDKNASKGATFTSASNQSNCKYVFSPGLCVCNPAATSSNQENTHLTHPGGFWVAKYPAQSDLKRTSPIKMIA